MDRRFPSTTRSIACFFLTHKETVDSETEENKTKEDDSDEEATNRSQQPNSSCCKKKFIKYSVVERLQLVETQWDEDVMWTVYPLWETVPFY